MPKLSIPNFFRDGDVISAADFNTNTTAVTTLVNTTKLDRTNFRRFSGITNDMKAAPYSWVPAIVSLPSIGGTAGQIVRRRGLFALGHYAQYPTSGSLNDGKVTPDELVQDGLIYLDSVQGCYRGTATNLQVGDTLKLYMNYRQRLYSSLTEVSLDIKASNTVQTLSIAKTAVEYVHVDLELVCDGTVATRTVPRPWFCLWLKYPHVG